MGTCNGVSEHGSDCGRTLTHSYQLQNPERSRNPTAKSISDSHKQGKEPALQSNAVRKKALSHLDSTCIRDDQGCLSATCTPPRPNAVLNIKLDRSSERGENRLCLYSFSSLNFPSPNQNDRDKTTCCNSLVGGVVPVKLCEHIRQGSYDSKVKATLQKDVSDVENPHRRNWSGGLTIIDTIFDRISPSLKRSFTGYGSIEDQTRDYHKRNQAFLQKAERAKAKMQQLYPLSSPHSLKYQR